MPFKDRERQREYQARWYAERRVMLQERQARYYTTVAGFKARIRANAKERGNR